MKHLLYSLILCLSSTFSFSQEKDEEISHYVFPEFCQGTVLMKNKKVNKAMVNYNAITEEMLFKDKGTVLAIGRAEMERIDTIFVKERKFFVLNQKFVEVINSSKIDLYAEYKCKVIPPGKDAGFGSTSETAAIRSVSAMNSTGRLYDLKLPGDYDITPYSFYWLKKKGEVKKFTNMKQLMKLFPEQKDKSKAFIKKHGLKYENQEDVVQLINYLATD